MYIVHVFGKEYCINYLSSIKSWFTLDSEIYIWKKDMQIFIRTNTQLYYSPFETKSHAKKVDLTRRRNRTVARVWSMLSFMLHIILSLLLILLKKMTIYWAFISYISSTHCCFFWCEGRTLWLAFYHITYQTPLIRMRVSRKFATIYRDLQISYQWGDWKSFVFSFLHAFDWIVDIYLEVF